MYPIAVARGVTAEMNILMLVNPRSGIGEPPLYDYVAELGRRGSEVTVRFMREDVQLARLLRDVDAYDRVVAVGGDGTISSVAYAMRNTGIPLVPYPSGTANLFAHNVGIPQDPYKLAELTAEGIPASLDIGELDHNGGVGFLVMAGAGFDAALMDRARDLKPLLGEGAYFLAAAQTLLPTVASFVLRLDGRQVMTEGIAVVLVNLARIQFDLSVTHGSDAQDGMLEVVIVKPHSVAGLLPAIWAALLDRLGEHAERPGLEIHSAREVEVVSEPRLPIQSDGEIIAQNTPLTARVLPGAATVVIPGGSLPVDSFPVSDGRA
ncbi:MAG: diacylglycerol kinase [Actinomycetia bacterium]|nr:diacylglycerol kinase [Actinomycetes bacterium]